MDMDIGPDVWRRRRATRTILVAAVMLALIAVAVAAPFLLERSKPRGVLPVTTGAPATPPAGTSASTPSYPDPFLAMTPAGIEALDEEGLCKAMCRTNLQCYAFRRPDSAGKSLERMLSACNLTCKVGAVTPHDPDPKGDRWARDCLKKLDCARFDECAFGGGVPPSPGKK
jgi:hypothetical protein